MQFTLKQTFKNFEQLKWFKIKLTIQFDPEF